MSNDEISTLAVNALMDKIASMVAKGKPNKGLTEDEHAIGLAHVVTEIASAHPGPEEGWLAEFDASGKIVKPAVRPLSVWYAIALRATKNCSQMRQVAEKRKILAESQKGDKVADVFSQYA
jgi:hypothetical protein